MEQNTAVKKVRLGSHKQGRDDKDTVLQRRQVLSALPSLTPGPAWPGCRGQVRPSSPPTAWHSALRTPLAQGGMALVSLSLFTNPRLRAEEGTEGADGEAGRTGTSPSQDDGRGGRPLPGMRMFAKLQQAALNLNLLPQVEGITCHITCSSREPSLEE